MPTWRAQSRFISESDILPLLRPGDCSRRDWFGPANELGTYRAKTRARLRRTLGVKE